MNISSWSHPATEIRKVQLLQPFYFCPYCYVNKKSSKLWLQKTKSTSVTVGKHDQCKRLYPSRPWVQSAQGHWAFWWTWESHWRGIGQAQIIKVPAQEAVSGGSAGELYFCTGQYGPLILPFLPCPYFILLALIFIFCFCVGDCLTVYSPCIITFSHNYILLNWCSCVRQSELCLNFDYVF